MFSVIWTFSDFQLVYVLTGGGPSNQTHLFATYAFNIALGAGQLGSGASVALSMLPPLLHGDRRAEPVSHGGLTEWLGAAPSARACSASGCR